MQDLKEFLPSGWGESGEEGLGLTAAKRMKTQSILVIEIFSWYWPRCNS
jgi:hypothetical protein